MEKYLFYLNGIFLVAIISKREIAQFGRAPGLGPGGRRFESCHPDLFSKNKIYESVAQLDRASAF